MRILIVEDNPLILLLAQRFLEEAGYDVVTADDGPAALQLIDNLPSALDGLIIDFMLPTMNGAEIVERMRQAYPTVPMIMASAFPDAVPDRWLRHYGVELLMKPYTGRGLVDAVRQLMSKYPRDDRSKGGSLFRVQLHASSRGGGG